ncbi:hypothetical protein BGX20_006163, partial [Mortierella sp. AD010]
CRSPTQCPAPTQLQDSRPATAFSAAARTATRTIAIAEPSQNPHRTLTEPSQDQHKSPIKTIHECDIRRICTTPNTKHIYIS